MSPIAKANQQNSRSLRTDIDLKVLSRHWMNVTINVILSSHWCGSVTESFDRGVAVHWSTRLAHNQSSVLANREWMLSYCREPMPWSKSTTHYRCVECVLHHDSGTPPGHTLRQHGLVLVSGNSSHPLIVRQRWKLWGLPLLQACTYYYVGLRNRSIPIRLTMEHKNLRWTKQPVFCKSTRK